MDILGKLGTVYLEENIKELISEYSDQWTEFEAGKSFQNISEWLEKAKKEIRIATVFFTIKGWNLIRRYTTGKQTYSSRRTLDLRF